MNDDLGDRMKGHERVYTQFLPRRTNILMRMDGRAFHTLTRNMDKPFDKLFIRAMDEVALALAEEISGATLVYVQSDEISVVMQDFKTIGTQAWFGGNIQKMTSVAGSIATEAFNHFYQENGIDTRINFDARVWTIADPVEVENYFVWRQQDCSRNSVQMVARSLYSHKELEGKNNPTLQDMIHDKGQNWNDYPIGERRGRCIVKVAGGWQIDKSIPVFTQDREYLSSRILKYAEAE